MTKYYLHPSGGGYTLSGGRLETPLDYPGPDGIEYAKRMVGFLAQVTGAELRINDRQGNVIETKTFCEGVPPPEKSLVNMLRDGTTTLQPPPAVAGSPADL